MRRYIFYFLLTLLFAIFLYRITMPSVNIPETAVSPADSILIEKSARKLYLLKDGKTIRTYNIALGFSPVGHKQMEGDGKTPEGHYKIIGRNPRSAYHLSLRISYPAPEDIKNAKKYGVSPGGDIMIHGLPNSMPFLGKNHIKKDWTAGCIAVTNEEIREIWSLVPNGTPVDIRP